MSIQPGAPEELSDAQKLIVIASRLDGLIGWFGEDHAAVNMIHDIPEKLREIIRNQLLQK